MVKDTLSKANISEAAIRLRLLELGKKVIIPLSSGSRWDMAVDNEDGTITRGQIKHGRIRKGAVQFHCTSQSGHNRPQHKHYRDDVEVFWVYVSETKKTYEVPVDVARTTLTTLRIDEAKNCQRKSVRLAKNFEM